jgi:dipeptidyl aminopeptidase
MSTEESPLQQHLYKIDLSNQNQKTCLTCSETGYYTAHFSPKRDYYVLYNEGPGIPTAVIKKVDGSFQKTLEDNRRVKEVLSGCALPKTRHVVFEKNGILFNAVEMVPPDFDPAKKYPVLFHVYGGPDSQMVSYKYEFSWSTYLASKLDYIIVKVISYIVFFFFFFFLKLCLF